MVLIRGHGLSPGRRDREVRLLWLTRRGGVVYVERALLWLIPIDEWDVGYMLPRRDRLRISGRYLWICTHGDREDRRQH